jgi:hypothetical protein
VKTGNKKQLTTHLHNARSLQKSTTVSITGSKTKKIGYTVSGKNNPKN